MNLIPIYLTTVPARASVDSGAFRSIISSSIYAKIIRSGRRLEHMKSNKLNEVYSADGSPMKIQNEVETDIKIGGISFPFNFFVINNLGYDCIIGIDLLKGTESNINIRDDTLELFDGFISVPMTKTGNHIIVSTVTNIRIPPYSEGIFKVLPNRRPIPGTYIIEGEMQSPCRSLLIARTLLDSAQQNYSCRVLNTTEKEIKLRPKTPIGILSPVSIIQSKENKSLKNEEPIKTLAEMRAELEAISISFSDTDLQSTDLGKLIELIYQNKDLMATSPTELPGTKLLRHYIDTGNSPPISKRSFRHSPQDKIEISRQTNEMLKSGIITESDTPWSSPVLLVRKKDGSKRFVCDFRALNSVTTMTSYMVSLLDDVIDTISEHRPQLWSSLDLSSAYWQAE